MSRSKMADDDDLTDVGDEGIEDGESEPIRTGDVERRGDRCVLFIVLVVGTSMVTVYRQEQIMASIILKLTT